MTMSCCPTSRSTTNPTLRPPEEAITTNFFDGVRERRSREKCFSRRHSGNVAPRCVVTSRPSITRTCPSSKTTASSMLASGMQ